MRSRNAIGAAVATVLFGTMIAGGNRDFTLKVLPKANHAQWEAKVGSNAETKSLQRFVPAYFTTIQDWLANRIRGFGTRR